MRASSETGIGLRATLARWLRFRRADKSAAELVADVAARVRLVDLAIEEPDIEDIVRRIYTDGV